MVPSAGGPRSAVVPGRRLRSSQLKAIAFEGGLVQMLAIVVGHPLTGKAQCNRYKRQNPNPSHAPNANREWAAGPQKCNEPDAERHGPAAQLVLPARTNRSVARQNEGTGI